MNNVDVIIPVYRGLDETCECIISAYNSLPSWANLIVINDKSPDIDLTIWLKENKSTYKFELFENSENLGFVKTVNKGMKLNKEHDVLLLNSDVEVADSNWLERMRNAAYSRKNVGSVTPTSNNATICSFPNFCEDNELFANLSVNELDKLFSTLDQDDVLIEVPTGIGFCMYITREALNDVGYFDDATFGKGYGEENDWCQRAIKKGWLNFHQLNVFAYHKGGVSFAEEGDPRKERALELLAELHPNYDLHVQQFIAEDPAADLRLAAIIAYFNRSPKKKILFVSHCLGGGVKQHINELLALYSEEVDFIQVYPSTVTNSITIQYYSCGEAIKQQQSIDLEKNSAIFVELIAALNLDLVHFHHTMGIPQQFIEIFNESNLPYYFTIHDYYLFGGNPTLTDVNGHFVSEDNLKKDQLLLENISLNEDVSLFKSKNKLLLAGAKNIIFPSIDVYTRFKDEFPFIVDKSVVAYHPDIEVNSIREKINSYSHSSSKKLKVLVFGALSKEKGANELEFVANNTPNVDFHLIGYAYKSLSSVITHGAYKHNDLEAKIELLDPDVVWFPANWPETYSYTLSTALLLKYPIVCPDIGAFSERTIEQKNIFLLKNTIDTAEVCDFWKVYSIDGNIDTYIKVHKPEDFFCKCLNESFYQNSYLNFEMKKKELFDIDFLDLVKRIGQFTELVSLSKKEKILFLLWSLKNSRMLSFIINCIPYKLQRAIKRKLSRKPIHEIINIRTK